jgi:uncharacterized repeat protein (TIGR03806 family)
MKHFQTPALLLATLLLAACGGGGEDTPAGPSLPNLGTGKTFFIEPGPDATAEMIEAMVTVVPGDTIEFDCGFFDLTTTLQLANTEAITIKGCGREKTLLSFKGSNQPVGILAVNVRGLVIKDLTVADTEGNGFELRAVDHGTLSHVRAFWSSGGGKNSATPITKDTFAEAIQVECTDPATVSPNAPENDGPGADTTSPDYTVSDKAGRYGIYPVSSENILIEHSESIGASDAGIYVGQTNTTIIRNSRAAFNVFGFEIENVQGGEYYDNLAECNTGGFLIYDLDGNLRQYGDRTRMYRNVARMNNTYNFTENGFVSNVPAGSGLITLSYDRIDIFDNVFENNNTGGIIHVSYELFPEGFGRPTEKRIDFYTEGVHIFRNTFINNGNNLPEMTTQDMQNTKVERLLPALVGYKNQAACAEPGNAATCAAAGGEGQTATGYRGAHILWDGLLDRPTTLDDDGDPDTPEVPCPYPLQADGVTPVPADERGKPQHTNQENPVCHYNAYKFHMDVEGQPRKVPDWWASCIDADNTFAPDSLTFSNFHGTKGANAALAIALWTAGASPDDPAPPPPPTAEQIAESEEFPADFDLTAHRCPTAYGKNLPPLPAVVIPPFVPSGNVDATPTPQEIEQLCNAAVPAGTVNFDAARVNCPRLDQYHLFSDPADPTSTPNSSGGNFEANIQGVPFALNTKLFSDYAVKYRVLFMPTGSKAIYKDSTTDGPNATLIFPVGTIIAKTFAFADEGAGTENVVETRLLIKRVNSATQAARWDGLVYIWKTGGDGARYAELSPSGGEADVTWNFHDVDSGAALSGGTKYQVPNHNQCLSCHSREDSEAGSAPIGLKVRNLNRPYASESPIASDQGEMPIKGQNQLAWLCDSERGLMLGCPDLGVNAESQLAMSVERLPVFNKAGDSGLADANADIEARARAYLEVNCQHCHNVRGFAASTGLYLHGQYLHAGPQIPVDQAHGICKHPTATGQEGSAGRPVDIFPGDALKSILEFRLSPAATSAAARMPPLARSVVHAEGHALIAQWIDDVVVEDESKYPNSTACQ